LPEKLTGMSLITYHLIQESKLYLPHKKFMYTYLSLEDVRLNVCMQTYKVIITY